MENRSILLTSNRFYRIILYLINALMLLFLMGLIFTTTDLICWNGDALLFRELIKGTPHSPGVILVMITLLYSVFLLLSWFRDFIGRESLLQQIAFTVMDILLLSGVLFYLNFSYKGIFLLSIIHIVVYVQDRRVKLAFLILVLILYILSGSRIASQIFKLFPLDFYIDYYSASRQLTLSLIRNILNSANEIMFFLYMIFELQIFVEETTRVRDLNNALQEKSEQLRISNIQLMEYSAHNVELAKLKERNRLAREIHDTVGHSLTGVELGLKAALELWSSHPGRLKKQLEKLIEIAGKGLMDIRRSLKELKPDALERYSLVEAVRSIAAGIDECSERKVSLEVLGEEQWISASLEEAIYRLAQEGVTNAVRHGKADTIKIILEWKSDHVVITVHDNGLGCPEIIPGLGLSHLKHQVSSLGGIFICDGQDGFIMTADFPLAALNNREVQE